MNQLKPAKGFTTSDGRYFKENEKLLALYHQQSLDLRGIVQSDERLGKKVSYEAHEVAAIIARNAEALAKIHTQYKGAINRERSKENKVLTNQG